MSTPDRRSCTSSWEQTTASTGPSRSCAGNLRMHVTVTWGEPRATLSPPSGNGEAIRRPNARYEWVTRRAPGLDLRTGHQTFETHQLRSEEHTSELQSQSNLVCRLLLEKK